MQVNGVIRAVAVLRAGFSIVRGSTNIQSATEMVILPSASVTNNSYYLTVLDSPATTSSTTYKVQFQSNSTGTVYSPVTRSTSAGEIGKIYPVTTGDFIIDQPLNLGNEKPAGEYNVSLGDYNPDDYDEQ